LFYKSYVAAPCEVPPLPAPSPSVASHRNASRWLAWTLQNCFTRWHFDKFPTPYYRRRFGAVSNVSWYLSQMPRSPSPSPSPRSSPWFFFFFVHTINFPLVIVGIVRCGSVDWFPLIGVVGIYLILCAFKTSLWNSLMSCVIG